MINLTPLFQFLIAAAAALLTRYAVPYLKERLGAERLKTLARYAEIAVKAAEQMYNYGDNKTKLQYALDYLKERGMDFSADELRAAVESAVYQLKNSVDESAAA